MATGDRATPALPAIPRRSTRATLLSWGIGLAIAALAFWLLLRELDWFAVADAMREGNYLWVGGGVLAIVATFHTRTRRWQALLRPEKVRLRPAMTALLMGQVVNAALPLRSGDLVRALWIAPEREVGAAEALGTIVVEKLWDLLALLACGGLLLALMPLPDWFTRSTLSSVLVLVLGCGLALAAVYWRQPLLRLAARLLRRLPNGWGEALLSRLKRLVHGLASLKRRDVASRALVWTLLTWGLGVTANLAVLAAFGLSGIVPALFLQAAIMISSAAPTPAQLGLFEGVVVISLILFGVPPDRGLAVGLVLHGVVMAPALLATVVLAGLRFMDQR